MAGFGAAGYALAGLHESNPQIRSFMQQNGGININPVSTPWCAAFANSVLASEGFPINNSPLSAQSFLNYGQAVTGAPQIGDVAVFTPKNTNISHVGVVSGFDANGNPMVLQGNSGNTVKLEAENGSKLVFRRPVDKDGKTPADKGAQALKGGKDSNGKQANGGQQADNVGSKTPVNQTGHKDITGSPSNYKETQTQSIVTTLPTHEPWAGHPKPKVPERQAFSGQPSNSGGQTPGSGGGGQTPGGGGGDGRSDQPSSNIDKSTDPQKAASIQRIADKLGVNATDLATIISYESAGTMSPGIRGGMNKDGSGKGSFVGLIQFSKANQNYYNVHAGQTFDQQMDAVGAYMKDRGVKPGASLLQMYSAVNAGTAGNGDPSSALYQRSDVNGNQLQHVAKMQKSGHRDRANKIMGSANKGAPERADPGMSQKGAGGAPAAPGGGAPATS